MLAWATKRAIRRDVSQSVRGGGVRRADWMERDAMDGGRRRGALEMD